MIRKLQNILKEDEAVLIVNGPNRLYYTGMNTSNGFILATAHKTCFYTDFRYITAAKQKVYKSLSVAIIEGRISDIIKEFIKGSNISKLLIEEDYLSYSFVSSLKQNLPFLELVYAQQKIFSFREIKSKEEIEYIKKAQDIADDAFVHICEFIKTNKNNNLTEKQIAFELEIEMRRNGSGAMPFSIICASGPNSALPHAVPSDRVVTDGDFITMDYGATYNNYCSDMTRTVAVGYITDEMKKIYDTVALAQQTAIDKIHAGMTGKECDGIARKVIEDAGYGEYFGHSLGHSVGLEVHESPNFSPKFERTIPSDTVLSVEPGIYIEGFCGVRIEDLVIVENDKVTSIAHADKSLIIL